MTRRPDVIDFDHQNEIVRDPDLARHFQASADRRHIPYTAVQAAVAVERNGACFQRPVTLGFASLVHDIPPSSSALARSLATLGSDGLTYPHNTRGGLAEREIDRLNTRVRVSVC